MKAATLKTRKCIECEKTLAVSHDNKKSNFYPIKAKNEEASRWENNASRAKKLVEKTSM
jgi:hypothetical protein